MWASRGKVAIVGVGYSRISRELQGTIGGRAIEACTHAVADAGLNLTDIDGLATFPDARARNAGPHDGVDFVAVEYLIQHLDIAPNIKWYAQTDEGHTIGSVIEAINAIAAGACNYALVWRALHRPAGVFNAVAPGFAVGEDEFVTPYGAGINLQDAALAYQRYLHRYGMHREDMATLVVTQRANANKNERAYFHRVPLTREDYVNSRFIADPLCLFDCDIPVEGAIALVLTSAERARDLKQPPAYVAGYGLGTDRRPAIFPYMMLDYMKSGQSIAQDVWERSGLGPSDVDVAELYEGFSATALYWLESSGFCKQGEALQFIQDGRIPIDGDLPLNTHGGALSEGRLLGMGHLAEAVFQVTGRADARQVAGCEVAYVTSGSPMLRGGGVLLTNVP